MDQIFITPVKTSREGFANSDIARGKTTAWWSQETCLCRYSRWVLEVRFNNTLADKWERHWFKSSVGQRISNFPLLAWWHAETLQSDKSKVDSASLFSDNYTCR